MDSDHLAVLCTCPDAATGEALAERLVSARLAACVNLVPGITSFYRWEGAVQRAGEVLLVAKTTAARYPALQSALAEAHPYELPEIVAVPLPMGLPGYLDWIDACTEDEA